MTRSEPHTLTVTFVEPDGVTFDGKPKWHHEWEVKHPASCRVIESTVTGLDGSLTDIPEYDCGVDHELSHVGLDGLTDCGREKIEPGEYKIEAWHHYDAYTMEHDGGLEIVD